MNDFLEYKAAFDEHNMLNNFIEHKNTDTPVDKFEFHNIANDVFNFFVYNGTNEEQLNCVEPEIWEGMNALLDKYRVTSLTKMVSSYPIWSNEDLMELKRLHDKALSQMKAGKSYSNEYAKRSSSPFIGKRNDMPTPNRQRKMNSGNFTNAKKNQELKNSIQWFKDNVNNGDYLNTKEGSRARLLYDNRRSLPLEKWPDGPRDEFIRLVDAMKNMRSNSMNSYNKGSRNFGSRPANSYNKNYMRR
jgi:hypothetical protein